MRLIQAAVLTSFAPSLVCAQAFRPIAHEAPAAELRYEFTQVTQVLELRDGRVLVLDRLDGTVRLADLRTGVSTAVGRVGAGPGEYRAPQALVTLGGDSVGILDGTSPRILVLTSDGRAGGFVSSQASDPISGALLHARTADARGRLHTEASSVRRTPGGTLELTDSAPLMRWAPGGTPALVVRLHRPPPPGAAVAATGHVIARPGAVPALTGRSAWAVDQDGRVAIVNADPYRVDLVLPDGSIRRGAVVEESPVAITDSIKTAYLSDVSRPQTVTTIDRAGNVSTGRSVRPPYIPAQWAGHLPPFLGTAFLAFDAQGRLWVQRPTFRREGGRYDVFGADGRLADRVQLPEGHRIVGFGRDAMYVARRDADDLEFLQRRPLPR